MSDYIQRQKDLLSKKYGKDELVAALLKDIKDLKIEKGKMQSEIDELKDLVKNKNEAKLMRFFTKHVMHSTELFTKHQIEIEINKAVKKATQELRVKCGELRVQNKNFEAKNYAYRTKIQELNVALSKLKQKIES
jgi:hypothetical protein